MKEVRIFWTGGWDSTFRLLQLSECPVTVHPIYIKDPGRASSGLEMARMETILGAIKQGGGKAQFSEIEVVDRDYILEKYQNEEISAAWKRLNAQFALGTQYEWFALFCKARHVICEVGIESSPRSKGANVIKAQCSLLTCSEGACGDRQYVLPKDGGGTSDGYIIFKDMRFAILNLSKEDMRVIAEKKGWLDIMRQTWFCFNPINGKPCGRCNPCKDAMNEGMRWRMPFISQVRYYTDPAYRFARKVKRKIFGIYRQSKTY